MARHLAVVAVIEFRCHCLLNGLDDIGLTLQNEADITAYEQRGPLWQRLEAAMTEPATV